MPAPIEHRASLFLQCNEGSLDRRGIGGIGRREQRLHIIAL